MHVCLPFLVTKQTTFQTFKALTPPVPCSGGHHHYEGVNAPFVVCARIEDVESSAYRRGSRGCWSAVQRDKFAHHKRPVCHMRRESLFRYDLLVGFRRIVFREMRQGL